jgi:hypothetical protein
MSKRIWRPLNTYGLLAIACIITSVMLYAILALASPGAEGASTLTIEVDPDAETCSVVVDEVVTPPPPPPPPPQEPEGPTDLGSFANPTWGLHQQRISSGEVVSMSFTADAMGESGVIEFTNNMPDMSASGYMFRAWFSVEAGGTPLNNNDPYCSKFSPNPNPKQIKWTQEANPARWSCDFGYSQRELYLNMEVGCYEGIGNGRCVSGSSYPGEYYVRVYPR